MKTDLQMADIEAGGTAGVPDEPNRDSATAHMGEFAQDMLLELRQMSRRSGCAYLAYLLELALIEASDLASGRVPTAVAPVGVPRADQPDLEEILRRIVMSRA